MFVTLEGVEGSGKTTIAKEIIKVLKDAGYHVLYTREPGGNKIAEQIREVILDISNAVMDSRTEALLYAAARRQHLVDVIIPALKEGMIVICDRFIDSSIAYQGYARGIGAELVAYINDFAIAGKSPDLTVFIDVKPEVGLERINKDQTREVNRLDLEELDFHRSVYKGYQEIARKNPHRIQVVNGETAVDDIVTEITNMIKSRLSNG
jgi:dTMP kinase